MTRGIRQLEPGKRPNIRLRLRGWEPDDVIRRHVKPLPRSGVAIGITGVMFIVFAGPLVAVGSGLDWQVEGDLFSGVVLIFQLAWMLGWSVAVIALGMVCVGLATAREGFLLTREFLYLRFDVLFLAIGIEMPLHKISKVGSAEGSKADGTGWRGHHLGFHYHDHPIGYGTHLSPSEISSLAEPLQSAIESGAGGGTFEPEPDTLVQQESGGITPNAAAAPLGIRSPSTVALMLANFVPLVGVVFLGWAVGEVMLLFWAESAIIGLFNIAKMALIGRWAVLFMGVFFLGHYGGFMAGHLLFIYAMFMSEPSGSAELASIGAVLGDLLRLWPALAALFVSHGISFAMNFLGRREYLGRRMSEQMHAPYKRIIVMHVTIIFGGGIALMTASAVPALVLMIVLKVAVDVRAHLKEHGAATA